MSLLSVSDLHVYLGQSHVLQGVHFDVRSVVQQHWGKKPLCVVHVLTA